MVLFAITFSNFMLSSGHLVVNLAGRGDRDESAIKLVSFCLRCPDPTREGSQLPALNVRFGQQEFSITAQLAYCVPNYVEKNKLFNYHQLFQRIAFVERGKVSVLQKVLRIQQQSKAVGVIVADDGTCDESFRFCGPRAGSVYDGGFAAFDDEQLWKKIELPVLVVTATSAERLRAMMGVERVIVRGLGLQNVSAIEGNSEF